MSLWKVHVCLDADYDDIEADTEEDAFLEASEAAMAGGCWSWDAECIDEEVSE